MKLLLILPPDTPVPALEFQGAYGVVESRELHALATRPGFCGRSEVVRSVGRGKSR